jgi:hypothetical protein
MLAQRLAATCVFSTLLTISASACGCQGIFERSVEVEVLDARTGAWAAEGAVGVLAIGGSTEPLMVMGFRGSPPNDTATTLGSEGGRAGMYRVVISKLGYVPWHYAGVVREGSCGVHTAHLTARLLPDA